MDWKKHAWVLAPALLVVLIVFAVLNRLVEPLFFFCKQKTAYEITYGDWSSDVCSSDLAGSKPRGNRERPAAHRHRLAGGQRSEERRVGKEGRRLCISRWSAYH